MNLSHLILSCFWPLQMMMLRKRWLICHPGQKRYLSFIIFSTHFSIFLTSVSISNLNNFACWACLCKQKLSDQPHACQQRDFSFFFQQACSLMYATFFLSSSMNLFGFWTVKSWYNDSSWRFYTLTGVEWRFLCESDGSLRLVGCG